MKNFPVLSLNPNITDAISQIVSTGIADGIKEGLDPQIHSVDKESGPVSTVAEITELPVSLNPEYKRKVSVSAAYMQVLWIICNIALKKY